MVQFWATLDLQKKSLIIACLALTIWLASFFFIFIQIESLNHAALSLEYVEDLYDTILEMRRFEKNFFLYHDRENREQILLLFNEAQKVYRHMKGTPEIAQNFHNMNQWNNALKAYGGLMGITSGTLLERVPGKEHQEKIRKAGHLLVDLSQDLLEKIREKIEATTHRAVRLPLISAALIIGLFFLGMILLNRRVINPLVKLERATKKIGHGDFSPIYHSGKIESEVDRLILAFNRMIEELDARQEQIVHDRKIASLGTLVSGVAHELNNPINNIILTVDVLVGKRKVEEEKQTAMLNDILYQAIRASGIVKNLLDFSRAGTSVIEDVDVNKVMEDILKITRNELNLKKITLDRQMDADLPCIRGNHQELQQVFLNLIVNAIHSMKKGGRLAIRTGHDEDGRVFISVKDNGEGIPEDIIPNIFDPFFTTKEVGHGTGLGLSVSYGIIKKLGGRIDVNSAVGEGSTFTVLIPAKKEMVYE